MSGAFYGHWTAATWAAVLGTGAPVLLALVGGVTRSHRLRKPVVIRRARTPGKPLEERLWPRAPVVADPGAWQLARAVFQVNNRSDFEQVVLFNGFPRARILWLRRRRGLSLCPGQMVLAPQTGGWVGVCVVVRAGRPFKQRDRLFVRVSGRLGHNGKRISYMGFARLYQYPQVDGHDLRGGNAPPG